MKTVIDYLIYPYEREISREQLRQVGTRIAIWSFLFSIVIAVASPLARLFCRFAYSEIIWYIILNVILYQLAFAILIIGVMMRITSKAPARQTIKFKYQIQMSNVVAYVALCLLCYITFFSGLPLKTMVICTVVAFIIIGGLHFLQLKWMKKERQKEVVNKQTYLQKSRCIEPDFMVFFSGIKIIARRKYLLTVYVFTILALFPLNSINMKLPLEININYLAIPVALIGIAYLLRLQHKWKLEESPELENI